MTFLFAYNIQAQLSVSPENDPQVLIESFLGSGVTVSNVQLNCGANGAAIFDGTASNIGIDQGILLTTGTAANAVGPNNDDGISENNNSSGDPDLNALIGGTTFDRCVLEFDFVPLSANLTFSYVFGSEEYLEYVDQFNDAFALFISGPGFTGLQNIAFVPGTSVPVTINNINDEDNSAFFVNNGDGQTNVDPNSTIQYDGFTTVLTADVMLTPCETYTLKIAIADAVDSSLDSGVFLQSNSLGTDFAFGTPTQNCELNGSYSLEIPFDGSGDMSEYTFTEQDASLGVSALAVVDDGTVGSVTFGPYPNGSSWNIAISGDNIVCDDQGGSSTNLTGDSECIACDDIVADISVVCQAATDPADGDFTGLYEISLSISGGDGNYTITGDLSSEGTSIVDPASLTNGSIDISITDGAGCPGAAIYTDFPDCADICVGVEPGSPCDDSNECTINDVIQADCSCAGENQDADGDTVCDADDVCPDFDDLLIGTACDDLDPCTVNDTYLMDCSCVGTFADDDGDGVCDAEDVCPDFDDALIGTVCDDGDACTTEDVYGQDCNCAGTFADADADTVCDAEDVCPDFDDLLIGTACDDGDVCTVNDTYLSDCSCVGTYADDDNDGVCDAEDVCPDFDDALIGTACDDGDACTINDAYANDCECVGLIQDTDEDGICDADDICPLLDNALFGTPCDDMDANTEDDVYTMDCICLGTPICNGVLDPIELNRIGALCADQTMVPVDGSELYTWYNAADEQVAEFTGNPYFSPNTTGSFYAVVTHPDYEDCSQVVGPRVIDTLDGCCELEEE